MPVRGVHSAERPRRGGGEVRARDPGALANAPPFPLLGARAPFPPRADPTLREDARRDARPGATRRLRFSARFRRDAGSTRASASLPASPRRPLPPARPLPSRRALVLASLASLPPRYRVLETDRGAIAYLGGDRGFAPQVLSRGDAAVALVSPTLPASRVADAFTAAIASSDDPKRRALALKAALRALGTNARFSFALLDLRTGRVFAASTALSSPLAVGHAPDGTLLVACTRSGAKAATHWPPRWAGGGGGDHSSASCRVNDGSARGGPKGAPAVVSGGGASSLSPPRANAHASHSPLSVLPRASRCVSPATTDRSRSRSPGAWSTHSSGSSTSAASDASWRQREAAAGAARSGTRLTHLPAGRFVYGRNYLQPFEFSAFWSGGGGGGGGARGDDEAGDVTPGRTRECGSDVMRSGGAREIATEDAKAREGSEGSWRGRGGGDVDPHQRPAPRGFAPRREEEKKKHAGPEDAGGSPFPARGVSETDAERSPAAFQGRRYSRVAWTAGPATRPSDAASTWRASAANAKGGESGGEESRDARLGAAPPRALDQDEVGTPKKPEAGGPAIAEPNAGAEVEANAEAEAEAEANANADSSASDGPSSPFKSRSSPVAVPTTSRASSAARSRLTWPGAPRDESRGRAPTPDPEMMLDLSRAVAAARWAGGAGAGAGARPGPPGPAAPGDGSLEDLRASWPAPPPPAGGGPRTRARSALARGGGSLDALLSLGVEEEERRRGGASSVERGWPSAAGGGAGARARTRGVGRAGGSRGSSRARSRRRRRRSRCRWRREGSRGA